MLRYLTLAAGIALVAVGSVRATRGVVDNGASFPDFWCQGNMSAELDDMSAPNSGLPDDIAEFLPGNEGAVSAIFTEAEAETHLDASGSIRVARGISQGNVHMGTGLESEGAVGDFETVGIFADSTQDGDALWAMTIVQRTWSLLYVQWEPASPSQSVEFLLWVDLKDINGEYNEHTLSCTPDQNGANVDSRCEHCVYDENGALVSRYPRSFNPSVRVRSDYGTWETLPPENAPEQWSHRFDPELGFSVLVEQLHETSRVSTFSSLATPYAELRQYHAFAGWEMMLVDNTCAPIDPAKQSQLTVFAETGNYIFVWEIWCVQNFDTSTTGCPFSALSDHNGDQPDN